MITDKTEIINILHRAKNCKVLNGHVATDTLSVKLDNIKGIKMNSSIAYRKDFELITIATRVNINYYDDCGEWFTDI